MVLNTEENVSDLLFAVHRDDRNVSPAELAEEVYEAEEYLQQGWGYVVGCFLRGHRFNPNYYIAYVCQNYLVY